MDSICLSLVASWIIQGCRIPTWLPNIFNTRLTIDKRVAGCKVIIGCRQRLKPNSSPADSLVISSGLNENHGLNPSQEIRKMWVHYWCPFTGCCFFPSTIRNKSFDWPTLSRQTPSARLCTLEALLHFSAVCCFTTKVIHSAGNSVELVVILTPPPHPLSAKITK